MQKYFLECIFTAILLAGLESMSPGISLEKVQIFQKQRKLCQNIMIRGKEIYISSEAQTSLRGKNTIEQCNTRKIGNSPLRGDSSYF